MAEAVQRHLLFKGLAAGLLGFPLSLWISWLLFYAGRQGSFVLIRDQGAMWAVVPLWCALISLAFVARSRAQCLAWLVAGNVLGAALCWSVQ